MKKIVIISVLSISTILVAFTSASSKNQATEIVDSCTSSETKKKCKQLLNPYSYDASKRSSITFKNKPQMKEVEIPLYIGEKYRIIFSREGLPQDIEINVYDHKIEAKHRNLLFSSKDFPTDQKEYVWEPEKSKKMYIDYIIPPTNDTIKKGCMIMVLGYLAKGK
ncbi:MAG: hypothetical protein JKY53_11885 [Flavobacteriales bacterium]|nr:hypothetical protein [Flavobacteriales bacterium]